MSDAIKLGVLCDFPFWEQSIGSFVRFASLCDTLATRFDVTAVSTSTVPDTHLHWLNERSYRIVDGAMLEEIDRTVTLIAPPSVPAKQQMVVAAVAHFVTSECFDAVISPYFNRHWMVEHLPSEVVRIVDTIDCQSQRNASFTAHGMTPTFVMTPQQEAAQLARYDMALSISEEDQHTFASLAAIPVVTAPFRLPPHPIYSTRETSGELLFIAARSPINDRTLDFLLNEILPLVDRPMRLHVVGNVSLPERQPRRVQLSHHKNLDNLDFIYRAVDIALNPTYAGGGVKTKTLEAIRYGVPILTTDEGARGLRHLLPDDLVVNDKEGMARRLRELLDSPLRRQALSQEMLRRAHAENASGWIHTFEHLLLALILRKSGRVASA